MIFLSNLQLVEFIKCHTLLVLIEIQTTERIESRLKITVYDLYRFRTRHLTGACSKNTLRDRSFMALEMFLPQGTGFPRLLVFK